MTLQESLAPYISEVETELRAVLIDKPLPFYGMMRYHLGWTDERFGPIETRGGKRLRPVLCLLACEAVHGSHEMALPAAVAVELLHNFSLIHDDIEDRSAERHHRRTVWKVWGEPQAINTGDGMHVLARLALSQLGERGVPPATVLRALQLLDETALRLCEGQYMDMGFETRLDIGVGEYLAMIQRKTGALLECCLELGAMLGTSDQQSIDALRRFGAELGRAFQMRDDLLGIWGQSEITGKATGDDIRQRKKTLPVIHAMEADGGRWRSELARILSAEAIGEGEVGRVLEILELAGSRQAVQATADSHYGQAMEALNTVNGMQPAITLLEQLAVYVTQRDS
ncbi:MAG: polyprenyl synthetase family protein [Chloroflexota bacterium]|nr:MAG: polyprenyl synthetase family protein [Chloroflexota bacterium]